MTTSLQEPIQATAELLLFPMDSAFDWRSRLCEAAATLGYSVSAPGRLWMRTEMHALGGNLRYADGFNCTPIHIGGNRHALSILPHRFYFESESQAPSIKPENELLADLRRPPLPPVPARIQACRSLAQSLVDAGFPGLKPCPMVRSEQYEDLLHATRLIVGRDLRAAVTGNPWSALRQHGILAAPSDFTVLVFAAEPRMAVAEVYARWLRDAYQAIRVTVQIRVVPLPREVAAQTRYVQRLVECGTGTVSVIGVPGQRGTALPVSIERFLGLMDRNKVRYRLFSVDNPQLRWSARDQAAIILQSAGGRAFAVDLPWPAHARNTALLGLDLGHPRKRRQSWVAATLLDPEGRLRAAARFRQPRDETIRAETLKRILSWVKKTLPRLEMRPDGFLVLRDGRLFEHETVANYRRHLGENLTFVDVTKHPVPLMVKGPNPAPPGTGCIMPDDRIAFLMASHGVVPGHIPKPVKVQVRHDGLRLGMRNLLEILTGLCYAPTLGLRPTRIPAPTYWSDGFAGISPTNRQFSGLGHRED